MLDAENLRYHCGTPRLDGWCSGERGVHLHAGHGRHGHRRPLLYHQACSTEIEIAVKEVERSLS